MKKITLLFIIISFFVSLSGCQTLSSIDLGSLHHSDSNITESVKMAIANNNQFIDAPPIHIETQNGHVLLSGYVKTIKQSDVAADVASKVPGVKMVENNLIVRK